MALRQPFCADLEPPAAFAPHPRLFFDRREIEELRAWAARDDRLRAYIHNFLEEALYEADRPRLPSRKGAAMSRSCARPTAWCWRTFCRGNSRLAEAAARIL